MGNIQLQQQEDWKDKGTLKELNSGADKWEDNLIGSNKVDKKYDDNWSLKDPNLQTVSDCSQKFGKYNKMYEHLCPICYLLFIYEIFFKSANCTANA